MVLPSRSLTGVAPAQANQCSRQMAGMDFGVKGTEILAAPMANHTPFGWDDVVSSSMEADKPPLCTVHSSCSYLPRLFPSPFLHSTNPLRLLGRQASDRATNLYLNLFKMKR